MMSIGFCVRSPVARPENEVKPTPVRANRLGKILRKMFNLAIRWRIRADNPVAGFARNAEAPWER